jgi:hypothetical protein
MYVVYDRVKGEASRCASGEQPGFHRTMTGLRLQIVHRFRLHSGRITRTLHAESREGIRKISNNYLMKVALLRLSLTP